jgi:hypothetical protein
MRGTVDDPKIRRLGAVALFQHCTPKEMTRLASIPDQAVLKALAEFSGVGRRFQGYGEIRLEGGEHIVG